MSKPQEPQKPSQPTGGNDNAKSKSRPGVPLRRALDDLAATNAALDQANSSLRQEKEAHREDLERNAEIIRDLRRQIHKTERDLGHARGHVEKEKTGREESEDREVEALRKAEDAARSLAEMTKDLDQLRARDRSVSNDKTKKVEELEAALAEAQAGVQRTEATHATIRERVVALESELSQARTRAIELTQSRDTERRARGEAEGEIARMERELADTFDRSEELMRMLNTATRIEHGLQRYADKKEVQLGSAKRMLAEARQRLDHIGNEITSARRRLAIPKPTKATGTDRSQAGLG